MGALVGTRADLGATSIWTEVSYTCCLGGVVVSEELVDEGPETGDGVAIFANEETPDGEARRGQQG